MAIERRWERSGPAAAAAASGTACIFCKQTITRGQEAECWQLKAVEDNPDTDFIVEEGFAHRECGEKQSRGAFGSRFRLPDVPK